jgi:site-specific DNA recombinase
MRDELFSRPRNRETAKEESRGIGDAHVGPVWNASVQSPIRSRTSRLKRALLWACTCSASQRSTHAVRDRLMESGEWPQSPSEQNPVAAHIAKVEVRAKHLAVTIKAIEPTPNHDRELAPYDDAGTMLGQGEVILIPWTKPPTRKFRDVIQPASASTQRTRPIRAERRAGLIRAIARGRQWLDEVVSGRLTIEEIAVRQKCSIRQINLTLSMAFLAPPLVKAAIEGRLPRGGLPPSGGPG